MFQTRLMSVRMAVHGSVFVSVLVLMLDVVVLVSVVHVGVRQVAVGVFVRVRCIVLVVVMRHDWLISLVRWRAASIGATPLRQQPGGSWRRGDAAAPPGPHAQR